MTRQAIPEEYLQNCSAKHKKQLIDWWESLEQSNQEDIGVLLDHRYDDVAFVYGKDETGELSWHKLPIELDDSFLQEYDENKDAYEQEWTLADFGYFFGTKEIVLKPESTVRAFNVCINHPVARAAIINRLIRCDFSCPINDKDCPIRSFVDKSQLVEARLIYKDSISRKSIWVCN
ncbi:hypothetical protein MNBD_GAMMA12-3089 [hydrothermal vent metagenome]|uniref:Uncharacterized protein n=1 Tax=hydrothermal vent metagenome TaxID=652676 RepID=A0A3B0Z9L8_9ZZZZ